MMPREGLHESNTALRALITNDSPGLSGIGFMQTFPTKPTTRRHAARISGARNPAPRLAVRISRAGHTAGLDGPCHETRKTTRMPILRHAMTRALASLLTLAALFAAPVHAESADVEQTRLDNGLTVLVIPDRRAPVVTHQIWYKVGSADEPGGSPASPTCSNT